MHKIAINASKMILDNDVYFDPTILIIDDSPTACQELSALLSHYREVQSNLLFAKSASIGFELLQYYNETIRVIFLDIVMPKVDGIECLTWIKDSAELAHIPVYMLTTPDADTSQKSTEEMRKLCLITGATDLLIKPLDTNTIKHILTRHDLISTTHDDGDEVVLSNILGQSQLSDNVSKSLSIGDYGPAFRLCNSNFQMFTFPDDIPRHKAHSNDLNRSLLLVFLPTIFMPELYTADGFMNTLRQQYNKLIELNQCTIICITSDLPYTLAAAKTIYNLPFQLLSDPSCRICSKYMGTMSVYDFLHRQQHTSSQHTESTEQHQQHNNQYDKHVQSKITSLHHSALSTVGLIHINKSRKVVNKWTSECDNVYSVTQTDCLNNDVILNSGNVYDYTTYPRDLQSWTRCNSSNCSVLIQNDKQIQSQSVQHTLNDSMHNRVVSPPPSTQRKSIHSQQGVMKHRDTFIHTPYTVDVDKNMNDSISDDLHILILHDNSVTMTLAITQLKQQGYRITTVYNGQQAYDLLCRDIKYALLNKSKFPYDLLLIDVIMPICDGIELLTILKSNHVNSETNSRSSSPTTTQSIQHKANKFKPTELVDNQVPIQNVTDIHIGSRNITMNRRVKQELALLPVVIISGLIGTELSEQCMAYGAITVLRKPFEIEKFQDAVKELEI